MKRDLIKLSEVRNDLTGKKIVKSVNYLLSKRPDLIRFESLEDLAVVFDANPSLKIPGFEENFLHIRSAITGKLWQKKVFLGTNCHCMRRSGKRVVSGAGLSGN